MAIELAVTGVSYRQAGKALEKLLGYPVISHEGIRQQLLNTEVVSKEPDQLKHEVLFVEVDGLYIKSQEKNKKGKEVKIAAVQQGWEVNGKRAKLLGKRHYIHEGNLPFWEGFEQFLMATYDYDPTRHHLVINGGAQIGSPHAGATFNTISLLLLTAFILLETSNASFAITPGIEPSGRNSQSMMLKGSWWN